MFNITGLTDAVSGWVWGGTEQSAQKDEKAEMPDKPDEADTWAATLWNLTYGKLGVDLIRAGLSLPCQYYEPLTVLQRSAETMAFCKLLHDAEKQVDSMDRLAYVCAFAVSGVASTERYYTNFNPVLGETYEHVSSNGCKFLAEQVSHHPPITANHVEADTWKFWQVSRLETRFLGNALDIDTKASSHLVFPAKDEHYWFRTPSTRVQSIIVGQTWLEHFGELKIINLKTKESCSVTFQKCGWTNLFSAIYDIKGYITNSKGEKLIELTGKWNTFIKAKWLVDSSSHKAGEEIELWRVPEKWYTGDKHNMTQYAKTLSDRDEAYEKLLPPTDSRLRPDRILLEQEKIEEATALKLKVEQRQRDNATKRGDKPWVPKWFEKIDDVNEPAGWTYIYKNNYWQEREEKKKALDAGEEEKAKNLLVSDETKGSQCDFSAPL